MSRQIYRAYGDDCTLNLELDLANGAAILTIDNLDGYYKIPGVEIPPLIELMHDVLSDNFDETDEY